MAGRKRKKVVTSGSDAEEEKERIDWVKKYFKLSKEYKEARARKRKTTRENHKMTENNAKLKIDLKYANHQVLKRNLMGSARGVIEWFERHHEMPPHVREDTRFNRWYWIFENDRSFRHKVDEFFESRPRAGRVASSVATIFGKASSRIVSFCTIRGLQISAIDYTLAEQNILEAICDTIPCTITIE